MTRLGLERTARVRVTQQDCVLIARALYAWQERCATLDRSEIIRRALDDRITSIVQALTDAERRIIHQTNRSQDDE